MLRGINPGQLDQKWIVQSFTVTRNATYNEEVKSWSNLKTLNCKEVKSQSQEKFEAKQQVAHDVRTLMCRYSSGVVLTETMS